MAGTLPGGLSRCRDTRMCGDYWALPLESPRSLPYIGVAADSTIRDTESDEFRAGRWESRSFRAFLVRKASLERAGRMVASRAFFCVPYLGTGEIRKSFLKCADFEVQDAFDF